MEGTVYSFFITRRYLDETESHYVTLALLKVTDPHVSLPPESQCFQRFMLCFQPESTLDIRASSTLKKCREDTLASFNC